MYGKNPTRSQEEKRSFVKTRIRRWRARKEAQAKKQLCFAAGPMDASDSSDDDGEQQEELPEEERERLHNFAVALAVHRRKPRSDSESSFGEPSKKTRKPESDGEEVPELPDLQMLPREQSIAELASLGDFSASSGHGSPTEEPPTVQVLDISEEEDQAEGEREEQNQPSGEDQGTPVNGPRRATEDDTVLEVQDFLSGFRAKYGVSHGGIHELYQFFVVDKAHAISRAAQRGEFPSMKTMRRRGEAALPKLKLRYTYLTDEGQKVTKDGATVLPRDLVKKGDRIIHICGYNSIQDLFEFYAPLHSGTPQETEGEPMKSLIVSSDGVEASKKGRKQTHFVSAMFPGCRDPIMWFAHEFHPEYPLSPLEIYQPIVDQVQEHGFTISKLVCDGKEQQIIRGMVATNGLWGCARCFTRGTTLVSGRPHFPYREISNLPREREDFILPFQSNPEWFDGSLNMNSTREDRQGLKFRTPFLDLDYFDIIDDVAIDAMHLLHEGVTETMWNKIFDPKLKKFSSAKRREAVRLRWNQVFAKMRVPTEIRRKTGTINPSKTKASQWQTMDSFAFVYWAKELVGPQDLRQLMLLYAFIVRVLYITDEDFQEVESRINLRRTMETFYKLYAEVFTEQCITFNMHSLFHAVDYRRKHGPVWQYSAAAFEGMYAKAKKCHRPNTPNIPKQLMNTFHADQKQKHHCKHQLSLHFAAHQTQKTDDTLVYYKRNFYKIDKKVEQALSMKRLRTRALNTSRMLADVPWTQVGVRILVGETSEDPITVRASEIKAKGVLCGDVISTMYPQWVVT